MNGYSIKIHKCWSLRGNLDAVIVVVTDIEINSVYREVQTCFCGFLYSWVLLAPGTYPTGIEKKC